MGKINMSNWENLIKPDPTDWLLEEENPSVRYFTLIDLLNKSHVDSEVIDAKKQMMNSEPVLKRYYP
jgi:hypothetical protein